jgi:AraC family transcriptional regulator
MKTTLLKDVHGSITKRYKVSDFILTESLFERNLELPKHFHENAHFCLLLKGSFIEVCGKQTLDCKPMSLSFLAAEEVHSDSFHSTVSHCFIIDVASKWTEYAKEHSIKLPSFANFQGGLLPHLAFRLYKEFKQDDKSVSLVIEGIILEIMAEASRHPIRSDRLIPAWLRQAREILHDRFSESLTHAGIAKTVGVHPIHLAREFRRHYHCTIGEYIRRLRIEYACFEICTSDEPLSLIAQKSGFFDQSHFARIFKQVTGIPPAEYRKIFRAR